MLSIASLITTIAQRVFIDTERVDNAVKTIEENNMTSYTSCMFYNRKVLTKIMIVSADGMSNAKIDEQMMSSTISHT